MNPSLPAILLLAILAVPAAIAQETAKPAPATAPAPATRIIATTYGGNSLHKVTSDGKITPFKLPAGTQWGSAGPDGSSDPLLSPDGKLLAFVGKGSILIRPLNAEKDKGTAVVTGYPNDDLQLTGWSPDGQSLVYFIGPPQGEDPPPSKVTEPKHFVYNLTAKKSREIRLDGSLRGWLPDGSMLLEKSDGDSTSLHSLALTPGAAPVERLKLAADLTQVTLSPDGTRIACGKSKPHDTSSSQLVAIELATGKETPIHKAGDWAEYQWPKWNPSGKRTAWVTRVSMKEGIPQSVLSVDGKDLTKPAILSTFEWLTDSTILIIEDEALAVLDIDTGKELGRKPTAVIRK